MTHWYYAVLTEDGGTWSTAVRDFDEKAARAQLARRYPRASVFAIER